MEVYETVILVELDAVREQVEVQEDSVAGFFDYFERTWIDLRIGLTRKRPMFSVPTWNHHQTLLTGK